MNMTPGILACAAILLGALGATSVDADEAVEAQARQAFEEGVRRFTDGDYEQALARFEASYSLSPKASVLFNVGMSYRALARYAESILALERFKSKAEGRYAELVAKATQAVEEMRSNVGWLRIEAAPDGASVAIDGRAAGLVSAGPVPLDPGRSKVKIEAPGYEPLEIQVLAEAGRDCRVRAPLSPLVVSRELDEPLPQAPALALGEPVSTPPQAPAPRQGSPAARSHKAPAIVLTSFAAAALIAVVPLAVITSSSYDSARTAYDAWELQPDQAHSDDYNAAAQDAYLRLGVTLGVAGVAAVLVVTSSVLWTGQVRASRSSTRQTGGLEWRGAGLSVRF